MVQFNNDWDEILKDEFSKTYYQRLRHFLAKEYKENTIYPNMYDIFNAQKLTAYKDVKVVILGQDPYHGPGQAHGLCFSVQKGVKQPPSLQNIFGEINTETGKTMPEHGNLIGWAKQGVLLLNTVLTVRQGEPNSHKNKGWEEYTDNVISTLNERQEPMVFMLWGANARAKTAIIRNPIHKILTAPHPSPLSAYQGFFGCNHFVKCNEFLKQNGMEEIDWSYLP